MSTLDGMQLRIKHTTGYHYENGAAASFNEARMTPATTSEQYVLRSRMEISPSPWTYEYRDYWGTTVTAFEVHDPHDDLAVVATTTVETQPSASDVVHIAWEDLAAVADQHCEYLTTSQWVAPADSLVAELDTLRSAADTPAAYATAAMSMVHARIQYLPGTTEVTTTAADAWEAGSGVCQDIAHLTLGALRHAGIPARYVSGYLHPSSEPVIGESVEGESHAWIEYWDGEWVGFDPTNEVAQSPRHVVVARGRDYADNPPLRGIYSTSGRSELFVEVEITRLR
ncbi:MAG: transglutaminase family protein [Aeromicrobium sp.]|uniref:transglutaminase family protein n=1 Tax=Aeromicrobium sp. TaxID=1871063 RepID=UPI003C58E96C